MSKIRFYTQTSPGVEEITWLEIRSRLPHARFVEYLFAKDEHGIVVFEYDGPPEDVLNLHTVEDVFMQVYFNSKMSRGYRDMTELTEVVGKSADFGKAANNFLRFRKFSQPPSYRVTTRLSGKYEYRRKDVETAVLKGLKVRYTRWNPVAQGGEVEVAVNLLGSQLLIGFRLSPRPTTRQADKPAGIASPLPSPVAAAMIYLTQPETDDIFLDPLCGNGTLLMERQTVGTVGLLLGGAQTPMQLNAAWSNLLSRRRRQLPRHISIQQFKAQNLPFASGSIDKMAFHLPSGKPSEMGRLYPALLAEVERVLQPGGRAVVFTAEYDLVKDIMRRFELLKILTGYSVLVSGKWGRIYILERSIGGN